MFCQLDKIIEYACSQVLNYSLSHCRYTAKKREPRGGPASKKRKMVKISVTVSGSNSDAFGADSFCEITDKFVDGKMRHFAFHENGKCQYWGTFSKRSKIVNSRRPFLKDEELRNYDVDSAEEWGDEEEGESRFLHCILLLIMLKYNCYL